ncbi:MAG: CDP-diacylglycerol--glycerol-3-phosphate 3-phosphatidyltransferase [Nitrospira sp.]|nr:CDP-diacylglycerol--glycerol-3-phosphate 3-phosphatidyltransferase [Candidatus Manganitrophaceae bacterium]HIL34637.1 CDP-diacylglycerol--glycerol-3-phosphate 3-phosphatidyltransferase [Candidatus Manganitrophaceae bacterium]
MNLPNSLTITRVLLIPFFIGFFYQSTQQSSLIAAGIFSIASITDILDGYFARLRSEVTQFGKFLDPVADKLLILSALILLVGDNRVSAWIAIVIIGREFAVTGFRAIASSEGIVIAAENLGKYKTALQVIAIILLIIDFTSEIYHEIGLLLLLASMVLALYSAMQYFVKYGRSLNILKVK